MKQFMAITQELHRQVEPLVKQRSRAATQTRFDRKSSNSARTRPRSSKPSSPTPQKKQWKELLGPPFELGD